MNLSSILTLIPLVLAAIAQQSATIPVTLGPSHYLVSISRTATPGHTPWNDALSIVLHLFSGQTGSFTVGVFAVSVTPLQLSAAHVVPAAPAPEPVAEPT